MGQVCIPPRSTTSGGHTAKGRCDLLEKIKVVSRWSYTMEKFNQPDQRSVKLKHTVKISMFGDLMLFLYFDSSSSFQTFLFWTHPSATLVIKMTLFEPEASKILNIVTL
jgi:hypothetical protein